MPERETMDVGVLIVGGGPAGLAAAIHLADLLEQRNKKIETGDASGEPIPSDIALLEKGATLGRHTLSGAIVDPVGLRELLPGTPDTEMGFDGPVTGDEIRYLTATKTFRLPITPPNMGHHGCFVASLGNVVGKLGEIAEKKGVQVFTGFAGASLLEENGRVTGVRTGDAGVDHHGKQKENYQPGADIRAKLVILAEGPRGHLTKRLIREKRLDEGRNPQVYSTAVKELWETKPGAFPAGKVVHLMGFPLRNEEFGGGFLYGLTGNRVALGLVTGLDWRDPTFDPHHAFQRLKKHPFVAGILAGGRILKYGAKTIPEGGIFSIPRLYHDGVLLAGDAAGFVNVPRLKGIHLAVRSGMLAARTAFDALVAGDFSAKTLSRMETLLAESPIRAELWKVRNFRQAFHNNTMAGAIRFGFHFATGGRGLSLSGRLGTEEDAKTLQKRSGMGRFLEANRAALAFDKTLTFDKDTSVYHSGTKHEEDQPSHLQVSDTTICSDRCVAEYGAPCERFCPAAVYEMIPDEKTGKKILRLHPSNCVHCKTCDIKDPYGIITWVTPQGGDGPTYENM
ncbi:MAG: electron transfer flavoprotein-ubiquinone oxidoreductase [Planctomycetota bacterium]